MMNVQCRISKFFFFSLLRFDIHDSIFSVYPLLVRTLESGWGHPHPQYMVYTTVMTVPQDMYFWIFIAINGILVTVAINREISPDLSQSHISIL